MIMKEITSLLRCGRMLIMPLYTVGVSWSWDLFTTANFALPYHYPLQQRLIPGPLFTYITSLRSNGKAYSQAKCMDSQTY